MMTVLGHVVWSHSWAPSSEGVPGVMCCILYRFGNLGLLIQPTEVWRRLLKGAAELFAHLPWGWGWTCRSWLNFFMTTYDAGVCTMSETLAWHGQWAKCRGAKQVIRAHRRLLEFTAEHHVRSSCLHAKSVKHPEVFWNYVKLYLWLIDAIFDQMLVQNLHRSPMTSLSGSPRLPEVAGAKCWKVPQSLTMSKHCLVK